MTFGTGDHTPLGEDLFPPHKCGLFLTHNEHRDYYETVEEWIRKGGEHYHWESDEAMRRAIDTDECWAVQWYPETPISFHAVAAPTLSECLAFARTLVSSSSARRTRGSPTTRRWTAQSVCGRGQRSGWGCDAGGGTTDVPGVSTEPDNVEFLDPRTVAVRYEEGRIVEVFEL